MNPWKEAFGQSVRVMELPDTDHIKDESTRTINAWRGYAVLVQPRLGGATATFFLTLDEAQAFESAARRAFPISETTCREAVWSQIFDGSRDAVTVVTGRDIVRVTA